MRHIGFQIVLCISIRQHWIYILDYFEYFIATFHISITFVIIQCSFDKGIQSQTYLMKYI